MTSTTLNSNDKKITSNCQIFGCKDLCELFTTVCSNHLTVEDVKELLKDNEFPEIKVLNDSCQYIPTKGAMRGQICGKKCTNYFLHCQTHKMRNMLDKTVKDLNKVNTLIKTHNIEIDKKRKEIAKEQLNNELIPDLANIINKLL